MSDLPIHVVVLDERFWSKVNKTSSCWLWTGSTDRNGYGQVRRGPRPGKLWYVHRLAYTCLVGPIADGLVIDHLCKTPRCLNPEHLEPVSQGVNVRRGKGNGYRDKTHCKRGHEFTPENTYRRNNFRQCIACRVEYDRNRYAAKKAS